MKILTKTLPLSALLILASGESSNEQESPMAGMTAEEHAMMQAGGMQGQVDSMGEETRQMVHL